jgi:hypothetical protein
LTYPGPGQVDVPLGSHIVVSFSDPVAADQVGSCSGTPGDVNGAFCVVGPNGPVPEAAAVIGDNGNVIEVRPTLEPDTEYQVWARPALLDGAENLPESEPLFSFRTRAERPRAAAPAVIAINGVDPASFSAEVAPWVLDFDTLRVLFSEPIDRRSVDYGSTVELLDAAGTLVPATLLAKNMHVVIDPIEDLAGGSSYTLRINPGVVDLGGAAIEAATEITFDATDTRGEGGLIDQRLRTRLDGDPGPDSTRAGVPGNTVQMIKPLIGAETLTLAGGSVAAQLGDPKVLGGPIPFVIRRGERLSMAGIEVKLGGEIPAGINTGDLEVHFLSDASGVLSRNPWRPGDVIPDNDRAPVYAELRFDIGVTARDATGLVVLSQAVLGVQATGTATATEGVLAIETIASMEMDLLGVTRAPTNMVLELITDESAEPLPDRTSPALIASYPADEQLDFAPGDGVELNFDEPIDIDRARAGGIRLEDAAGGTVPAALEVHGGTVVVRPLVRLDYSTSYAVILDDVADRAGNPLAEGSRVIGFDTAPLVDTDLPANLLAIHPGFPCALTGGGPGTAGRCDGGEGDDELYPTFSLAADEIVEAAFTQPLDPGTVALGAACGQGSVRVELTDGVGGACTGAVPGTFIRRDRGFAFVPDQPWVVGQSYRLSLISGGDNDCDGGELCSVLSGEPVNFDVLDGIDGEAGGPNLIADFVGSEALPDTFVPALTAPLVDQNGNGQVDGLEITSDLNRAALRITGFGGDVDSAEILGPDCIPETPEVEGCMYLAGGLPVAMGELTTDCPLPIGMSAAACLPVQMFPQMMYGTSMTMEADLGVSAESDTETMVMRVREPPGGPVIGYVIDDGGTPAMVVELLLYMDAPDMSVTLSDHDVQSKEASVVLKGPMSYHPDGRIQINLSNLTAIDMTVNIDAPFGVGGNVDTQVPIGEMRLQLLSLPLRGGEL